MEKTVAQREKAALGFEEESLILVHPAHCLCFTEHSGKWNHPRESSNRNVPTPGSRRWQMESGQTESGWSPKVMGTGKSGAGGRTVKQPLPKDADPVWAGVRRGGGGRGGRARLMYNDFLVLCEAGLSSCSSVLQDSVNFRLWMGLLVYL